MKNKTSRKVKRSGQLYRILTTFFVLLLIWIFIAPFLAKLLIVERTLARADAIWVLGGSSTYLERTQKAAELYKNGVAPKIFVVNDGNFGGWNQAEQRNLPFYEISKRELISQGVPTESIEMLPEKVDGTDEEAALFFKIAQERKPDSILLVTSAYHSRRTLWTFEHLALKNQLPVIIGIQTSAPGQQTPLPYYWWLSRRGWMLVGEEYVKLFWYWLYY